MLCHDAAGAPADTRFSLWYQADESVRTDQAGYVAALKTTTPAYTPDPFNQANSTGALNTVERRGVGDYTVTFPGFTTTTGNVQVSAMGVDASYCKVTGWTAETATVRCHQPTGAPGDTAFSLSYTSGAAAAATNPGRPSTARHGAYVRVDEATRTDWHEPAAAFAWSSRPGPITARRYAPGAYQVRLPGLPATNATNTIVTATGASAATCNPTSWSASPEGDTVVHVQCRAPGGAPVDEPFALRYATSVPAT